MKHNTKKMMALLAVMMVGVLILAGCGKEKKEESKKLYFLPLSESGAYWSSMITGAKDKAKELDYELVVKVSSFQDSQKNQKQIGFMQEAVAEKVAGVALAPLDAEIMGKNALEIKDAGIPLVTFDADLENDADRISYVGTNNTVAGGELAKEAVKYLKENNVKEGSIATVATSLTQSTMVQRQEGIKEAFKEEMGADADNFKWLEPIADEDQSAISKSQLEGQIVGNKDMVAVFSLGSEGPDTGVMEAIKSQDKAGEIYHFGFDYTPTWENGIEQKLITGIVDQDAYGIGEQVVEALVKSAKGEKVEKNYEIPVKWILGEDIIEYANNKK